MKLFLATILGLASLTWFSSSFAETKCGMDFELKSWSVFYKSGKGSGTVSCDNGQKARVAIRTQGGGITFGKNSIRGHGDFKNVNAIRDIYGSYASAGGHAGVVKSAAGQSLSKGDITLDINGTGGGVDLGFDFGSFKISRLK